MNKPKVFIGSSSESIEIAKQVKRNLFACSDPAIWRDAALNMFEIGKWPLESLLDFIESFDLAIFILSGDDEVKSRGESKKCPRDNVIFELGLFMSHLGRDRTLILLEKGKLKIPSDFAGMTVKKYEKEEISQSHLNEQCSVFEERINQLSFKSKKTVPIYPKRLEFMDFILPELMQRAQISVKILNIAFTILKNDQIRDIIQTKLNKGVKFEVLLAMRKGHEQGKFPGKTSYLNLRLRDECNVALISDTNQALFTIFLFLLESIWPLGEKAFNNFQIKEYSFVPVVCIYIIDDKDLIFGPYISIKCDNIPLIHLKKEIGSDSASKAFYEMTRHYEILSNHNTRTDKSYIKEFSFFDGNNEISIHKLIQDKSEMLKDHLTEEKKMEYFDYLVNMNSKKFNDVFLNHLGNFKCEGKFDAVMRHILKNISK